MKQLESIMLLEGYELSLLQKISDIKLGNWRQWQVHGNMVKYDITFVLRHKA